MVGPEPEKFRVEVPAVKVPVFVKRVPDVPVRLMREALAVREAVPLIIMEPAVIV